MISRGKTKQRSPGLRHSGMVRKHQTSDVQLHIGESLDSGFDASHRPGMTPPGQLPALAVTPKRTSSSSEEDTDGTWAPSEAREIATRVLLKTVSAAAWALRLLSSSATSTLYWPLESSATLPGVAEVRISALSGAAIGARPWEKVRKRRSYGLRR